MNAFIQHLQPLEINLVSYEGWYWMSHETQPVRLQNEPFVPSLLTHLPFVAEAQLYDKDSGQSISIRNVDGAYQIIRYDLSALAKDVQYATVERQVLGHRLAGNNDDQPYLKVVDIWKETPDENCAGFSTLVPLCSVFAGFKN